MKRIYLLFIFVSVSLGQFNPISNQWYKFINKNSLNCLQPLNSSTSDAANIVQSTNSGVGCQQWKFISAGSGYYTIQNNTSGKLMDINGASKTIGTGLIQYHVTGAANQQWQIIDLKNGYFTFKNKNSGLVLDIKGASKAGGAQCIQSTSNGTIAQQWQIVKISQTFPFNKNLSQPPVNKSMLRKSMSMAALGKKLNAGQSLPSAFNWENNGVGIGPAYSQGPFCIADWVFAAKSAYEIKLLMKGFSPVKVSAEQVITCNSPSTGCYGCQGGNALQPFIFWQQNAPMLESCTKYPDSTTGMLTINLQFLANTSCSSLSNCATSTNLPLMLSPYYIVETNVDDVKASIYWDGPGIFTFNWYSDFTDFWNSASPDGVFTEMDTGNVYYNSIKEVTVVGWDDSKQAYLCKNTWGPGNRGDGTFWISYTGHKVPILEMFFNASVLGGNFWTTTGNGSPNPGIRRYVRSADGTYSFALVPYPSGVNSANSIAGDPRGHIYITDTSGMVYSRNPDGTWNKIPGIDAWEISSASNFSITNNDPNQADGIPVVYVYAVTQDAHLYSLNSTGNGWNQVNTGPCASVHKVDVDCNGTIYIAGGISDNSGNSAVWRLFQGSSTWQQMGGYTSYVSDLASDPAYGTVIVGPYGHQSGLWLWNEGTQTWSQVPGTESMGFSCIDVGPEGIFGLIDWQTPAVYANGAWTILGQSSDPSISNVGCSSWR
jgi:hypothetical protein